MIRSMKLKISKQENAYHTILSQKKAQPYKKCVYHPIAINENCMISNFYLSVKKFPKLKEKLFTQLLFVLSLFC